MAIVRFKTMSLFIVALSGLTLLAGCGTQPAAAAPTPVKTDVVKLEVFKGDLSLTGVIDAQEKSNLSAQLPGTVVTVNAKEGTFVKRGAVIFSMDKKDLLNQLDLAQAGLANNQALAEQARINYENSEVDFTRLQELYQSGAIPKQQLEQITVKRDIAKSQYEAARGAGINSANAAINAIKLNLAKMDIKSPIEGVLVTCNVSVGDNVAPGIPIVTVVATNRLVLTGNMAESNINSIKIGDPVEVSADSVTGRTFVGKISYISPISIPTGQFFPIKVTVDNTEGILKAGMTATAKISIQSSDALVIPNSALLHRDDKDYVIVVKEGKAVRTAVRIGLKNETSTMVLQGLQTGDLIVIKGAEQLADGVEVM